VFIVADGPGPVHPSRCIAVGPGRQARLERPRRPRLRQPPVRFNLPSSGSPGLFRSASTQPIISAAAPIASGVRSRARWPRSRRTRRAELTALRFDIDTEGGGAAWIEAELPAPNLVVINPCNGHAHLIYLLGGWVRTDFGDPNRLKVVRYAAASTTTRSRRRT